MKSIGITGFEPTRSPRQRRLALAAVLSLLVLAAAAGGYLIGSASDPDVEPAGPPVGAAEAQSAPTVGSAADRAPAFKAGRERGFAAAYPKAYRRAYLKQFREAGLGAPAKVRVPDRGAPAGGAN